MFNKFVLLLLVIGAGTLVPMQVALNAGASRALGHVLWATAASYIVGGLSALALIVLMRLPIPTASAILAAPTGVWFAGTLGMVYITIIITAAPQIGLFLALTGPSLGQMIGALLLDQAGGWGTGERPITFARLGGFALVLIGLAVATADTK